MPRTPEVKNDEELAVNEVGQRIVACIAAYIENPNDSTVSLPYGLLLPQVTMNFRDTKATNDMYFNHTLLASPFMAKYVQTLVAFRKKSTRARRQWYPKIQGFVKAMALYYVVSVLPHFTFRFRFSHPEGKSVLRCEYDYMAGPEVSTAFVDTYIRDFVERVRTHIDTGQHASFEQIRDNTVNIHPLSKIIVLTMNKSMFRDDIQIVLTPNNVPAGPLPPIMMNPPALTHHQLDLLLQAWTPYPGIPDK